MILRILATATLLGMSACSATKAFYRPAPDSSLSSRKLGELSSKAGVDARLYFLRHQMADGSWGGRPSACECESAPDLSDQGDLETTSCVIISFVSMGFSLASVDEYPEGRIGPALRRGLDWLLALQTPDGAFDEADVYRNALAAYAVAEMHGFMGLRSEQTRRAVAYIEQHPASDVRGRIWQGQVLASAWLSGLGEYSEKLAALSESLANEPGPLASGGHLLLGYFARRNVPLEGEEERILNLYRQEYGNVPLSERYLVSHSLDWGDPKYRRWHDWFEHQTRSVLTSQRVGKDCSRGSLDGRNLRERFRNTAWFVPTLGHFGCAICGHSIIGGPGRK